MVVFCKKCVSRLSRYRKVLLRFKDLGFVKVFSDTVGDATGVTSAQVRKDFSLFGIVGNKRGGYNIDALLDKMQVILGKDRIHRVIVVGVGNIGRALIQYQGFKKEGIVISAGFDIDPVKINSKADIPVFPIQNLKTYVKKKQIEIAILSVPETVAQEICHKLVNAGIVGILNFAPIRLQAPEHVEINTVNLQVELENLIYFTKIIKKN